MDQLQSVPTRTPEHLSAAESEGVYASIAGTLRRGRRQIAAEDHTAYNTAATSFRDLRLQLVAEVRSARNSSTALLRVDSRTSEGNQAMGALMAVMFASEEVNPREDALIAVMKDADEKYVKSKIAIQYMSREFLAAILTSAYVYFFEVKRLVTAAVAHNPTCLSDCPLLMHTFYSNAVHPTVAPVLYIVENELMLHRDRVGGEVRWGEKTAWCAEEEQHMMALASQHMGKVPNPWIVVAAKLASSATTTTTTGSSSRSASACQRRYMKKMKSRGATFNFGTAGHGAAVAVAAVEGAPGSGTSKHGGRKGIGNGRRLWTAADDADFKVLVEKHCTPRFGWQSWYRVSEALTTERSAGACLTRHRTLKKRGVEFNLTKKKKKKKEEEEEEEEKDGGVTVYHPSSSFQQEQQQGGVDETPQHQLQQTLAEQTKAYKRQRTEEVVHPIYTFEEWMDTM